MGQQETTRGHFVILDALRGIAAIGVALTHFGWRTSLTGTVPAHTLHLLVDFFFVLSGLVIAANYGARLANGTDAARFMWLRFWRLYPLHLVLLLIFAAVEVARWYGDAHLGVQPVHAPFSINDGTAFISNLFLVQSFGINRDLTFNGVSWSISTEFYAYLAFAVVSLATRRLALVSTAIVAITGTLILLHGGILDETYTLWAFNRCLFSFFGGVIAFLLWPHARQALRRMRPAGAALLSAVPVLVLTAFLLFADDRGLEVLAAPLSAAIVLAVAAAPPNAVHAALSIRPLVWLGTISYSIYMVHCAVYWPVTQFLRIGLHIPRVVYPPQNDPVAAVPPWVGDLISIAALAGVLLAAHFAYRWIEAPWRNWSRSRVGAAKSV